MIRQARAIHSCWGWILHGFPAGADLARKDTWIAGRHQTHYAHGGASLPITEDRVPGYWEECGRRELVQRPGPAEHGASDASHAFQSIFSDST